MPTYLHSLGAANLSSMGLLSALPWSVSFTYLYILFADLKTTTAAATEQPVSLIRVNGEGQYC